MVFLVLLLIFCFSLSSDLRCPFSRKQKASPVALAPLKAVKRGAQSTPGPARPISPPPLRHAEGVSRQKGEGQKTGAPRPRGPEDVDLGGVIRPAQAEEGRVKGRDGGLEGG